VIALSLAEVAAAVGGTVADGDVREQVTGAAFVDSRTVVPGGLFVAVPGERVDGHDFAVAAVAAGAAGVLGSRPTGVPTVVVDDPVRALGRLARHVVDALHPPVLALTGSQGKTGTKDFLAQVLTTAGETVWTEGNLNNELGVPLTVLRATSATRFLALEMGARGRGHIAELCAIAPPDVAAVLNVGTAHLGEFGSREAIATAKGEIVEALPSSGTAVLNADDDLVSAMARRTSARVLWFGTSADVSWRGLDLDELGRPSFELGYDGAWAPLRLLEAGAHQVANAAAAGAMALAAGVAFDDVVTALGSARSLSPWRMALHERADGLVVVNDSYNANPASMAAALDALAAIGKRGRRRTVAVLGEMLELGETSAEQHAEVGAHAAELETDVLVTVGPGADAIAEGARRTPAWTGEVVVTAGREQAAEWLGHNVGARDVVLVKASRGAALERLADALVDPVAADVAGAPVRARADEQEGRTPGR
jgi:UDP-N-acetylmuramoyl-tripeptide--D-alanyl-D-alanine ligase